MIKECQIISTNDYVSVVRFGEIDVQFPSIKKGAKTVYVQFDNGKYSIVDHAENKEPIITEPKKLKKQSKKKHVTNSDDVVV